MAQADYNYPNSHLHPRRGRENIHKPSSRRTGRIHCQPAAPPILPDAALCRADGKAGRVG
jgi:hypothetical protein